VLRSPAMKPYLLLIMLMWALCAHEARAQNQRKSKSRKTTRKVVSKPAVTLAPALEKMLLGQINTGKMTIKIHRMVEVFLLPCEKCVGTDQHYKPKPGHRVLLFEISRRNVNHYELNAKLDHASPLYARILGSDNQEYPCYTLPSLIEIAMDQNKGITSQNAKMYYQLLGSAPPRTEHRAFALAVEMPLEVQPQELLWKKELMLKCDLNMQNNKLVNTSQVVAEKPKTNKTKKGQLITQ